ncbi:diguanylate cyclase domain-containing protein [Listeria valentina]|uniref:diguanylate cyclase domain-containing protein n=1 Tax=Listeria valentina TaxID=2705293 RepID=UPI0014322F42|nr:diguanylate cyclase [Listeria valentina]
MKKNQENLMTDIGFLLFILLSFACVAFTAHSPDLYFENLIFLTLSFFIAIVTYFTNLTFGLVLNVIFIFGYASFILYLSLIKGFDYSLASYFWLLMAPLLTVTIHLFTRQATKLQTENAQIKNQNEYLGTIDEDTLLKNIVSFQNDEAIFQSISTRYNLPLSLLVVKVRHWKELKRFQSNEEMRVALQDISALLEASIRTSDVLYLLNKEEATWGLLLLTDDPGSKLVMERIKERIQEANQGEFKTKYRVRLELRIGAKVLDPETVQTPFDFIEQAEKELEYDV